jgi:hypothetical protein
MANKAFGRLVFLVAILVAAYGGCGRETIAQDGVPVTTGWSENVLLTREGLPEGRVPRIAVDRQGRVHVFWMSWLGPTEDKPHPEAVDGIVYRRLEGGEWTEAIDVLATPQVGPLGIGSVAIDDRDIVNLLWFDQGVSRDLYFSQAHTSLADKASNWSTTVIENPQFAMSDPDLLLEVGGKVHIVYTLDHDSVVYLTSTDYGTTWSAPVMVWGVTSPDLKAVSSPRIAVDVKGYIHVVWTVNSGQRSWEPEAVWYARSIDRGLTWEVQEMYQSLPNEPTAGWINVAVRDGYEIHLIWNRGIGSPDGRYHTWSTDNGATWQEPASFLPEFVSGQTQWPLLVVDAAENLHLVTVAGGPPAVEGEGSSTRPRYAHWNGSNWSEMYTFPEGTSDFDTALAIGLGNQLHVVHARERHVGRLLYNALAVNAPGIPAQKIPDPVPIARPAASVPTAQPATEGRPAPTATALPTGEPLAVATVDSGPDIGIGLSVVPVVLLLLAVLIWKVKRGRVFF